MGSGGNESGCSFGGELDIVECSFACCLCFFLISAEDMLMLIPIAASELDPDALAEADALAGPCEK